MNKLQAQLNNQLNNHHHHHHLANYAVSIERKIGNLASYMGQSVTSCLAAAAAAVASSSAPISTISTTQTSIMPSRQTTTTSTNSYPKNLSLRSPSITPEPPAEHHHRHRDDEEVHREWGHFIPFILCLKNTRKKLMNIERGWKYFLKLSKVFFLKVISSKFQWWKLSGC